MSDNQLSIETATNPREYALMRVQSLPVIEENLMAVKEQVTRRVEEALSLVCTDSTLKAVKATRAQLNKEFAEMEKRRIDIKREILMPYQHFEAVYNDCVADSFKKADKVLGGRIAEFEAGLKESKAKEIRAYFDEERKRLDIPADLATFDSSRITVTMTASMKSLRASVKSYLDRIANEINFIMGQPNSDEIMCEYRNSHDAFTAIANVSTRHKMLEEERERRKAMETAAQETARSVAAVEEVAAEESETIDFITAPVSQPTAESVEYQKPETPEPDAIHAITGTPEPEPMLQTAFRVRGTRAQLKALKQFLEEGGYEYEPVR